MRAHRLVWIVLGIGCSSGTRLPAPIAAQGRPGIEGLLSDSAHLIAGKRVIVLDRPDPVGGITVQGNVRANVGDPDSAFSGFMPVAMRYGMTLGELARMANDVMAIGVDLVVVPALGWNRAMFYDQTGLPWVKPSPNMPDLESGLLYPGICLF